MCQNGFPCRASRGGGGSYSARHFTGGVVLHHRSLVLRSIVIQFGLLFLKDENTVLIDGHFGSKESIISESGIVLVHERVY